MMGEAGRGRDGRGTAASVGAGAGRDHDRDRRIHRDRRTARGGVRLRRRPHNHVKFTPSLMEASDVEDNEVGTEGAFTFKMVGTSLEGRFADVEFDRPNRPAVRTQGRPRGVGHLDYRGVGRRLPGPVPVDHRPPRARPARRHHGPGRETLPRAGGRVDPREPEGAPRGAEGRSVGTSASGADRSRGGSAQPSRSASFPSSSGRGISPVARIAPRRSTPRSVRASRPVGWARATSRRNSRFVFSIFSSGWPTSCR